MSTCWKWNKFISPKCEIIKLMEEKLVQQLRDAEILGNLRACGILLRKVELREPKNPDVKQAVEAVVRLLQHYDTILYNQADQVAITSDNKA